VRYRPALLPESIDFHRWGGEIMHLGPKSQIKIIKTSQADWLIKGNYQPIQYIVVKLCQNLADASPVVTISSFPNKNRRGSPAVRN
jgi:hypothetical protein